MLNHEVYVNAQSTKLREALNIPFKMHPGVCLEHFFAQSNLQL